MRAVYNFDSISKLNYLILFFLFFSYFKAEKKSDFFSFNLNYNLLSNVLILSKYFDFKSLMDLVVNDNAKKFLRFTLFYNFLNFYENIRLFICKGIDEFFFCDSLSNFFDSSIWLERENWDMFGIFFKNHKDLRRILTDYGFLGFPLKKDYPLVGFSEVFYDCEFKGILYRNLELMQSFRKFKYEINWY